MSNKTADTLFIFSPLATKHAEFYQELLSGVANHQQLGNKLISLGEQAHAFRQFDKVKEIGLLLANIPINSYQAIGYYFLGVAANSKGNGDQERAKKLFELATEIAPSEYKAKSLLSLAAVSINAGDFGSGFHYYHETIKAGGLNPTSIEAMKGVAVLKALEGYHSHAIKDLENILPLVRVVQPRFYFDYLNSYAVELSEAGRMDEAENVSRITIASPFAPFYKEWQATFSEIRSKRKSRSTIAFSLPEAQPESETESEPETKSVVYFPLLREAPPPQKPERLTPQELGELTMSEKRELILAAIRGDRMLESDYDKLMVMVGLLKLGPADKILDLEDDATLDDVAVVWANQIGPEELASVLSALRDCNDDLRRNNIIDAMIRIAFEQTQLCGLTEEAWRLRVERRLPKR